MDKHGHPATRLECLHLTLFEKAQAIPLPLETV